MKRFRFGPELSLFWCQGLGWMGADFWHIDRGDGRHYSVSGRYGSWGQLSIGVGNDRLLAPGPDGPVTSLRFEMLREGMQNAEARVFIERAVLDSDKSAKLGGELVVKCKEMLDERLGTLFQIAMPGRTSKHKSTPVNWIEWDNKLYSGAAEVDRALGGE